MAKNDETVENESSRGKLSRRDAIRIAGVGAAGIAVGAGNVRGLLEGRTPVALAASNRVVPDACPVLMPEQDVGPFYVAYDKMRSNMKSGQTGVDLALTVTLIDIHTCKPVKGAILALWQASAMGVYSDEASEGTSGRTYLRGSQRTDAAGVAKFDTIMPGWYPGRTVHIHVKVYEKVKMTSTGYSGTVTHIGQMFFPQSVISAFKKVKPYSSNHNAFVTNTQDSIYADEHGSDSVLRLTGSPTKGYAGSITFGINSRANHGK